MRRLLPAVILLMAMSACQDSDLQIVAKGLRDVAQTMTVVQSTAIEANRQGLISVADTRVFLELCVKINEAGQQATAVTKAIVKLNDPTKDQLLTILIPVAASISTALDSELARIFDQTTREKLKVLLLSAQSTLNAVNLILVGR